MPRYDFFEPHQPRRTDKGIKAQSKRGAFAKQWWADRWIKALEQLVDAGRLRRGRSYARSGQVLKIGEKKGGIEAQVQGSRPTPYKVTIELAALTPAQWQAVIDALAAQAIFTAQLLAGEMPREIEDAFAAAGVSLFPDHSNELITNCSCPDWANPCKHVAAVHYILGEQFDEDPFLLFRLRGRSQEQIIDALRSRRSAEAGRAELHEERADYSLRTSPPLNDNLEHFWTMESALTHFPTEIQPPLTPLPTLKRLGQPSFVAENLEQLLAPAYQAISEAALAAYDEAAESVTPPVSSPIADPIPDDEEAA